MSRPSRIRMTSALLAVASGLVACQWMVSLEGQSTSSGRDASIERGTIGPTQPATPCEDHATLKVGPTTTTSDRALEGLDFAFSRIVLTSSMDAGVGSDLCPQVGFDIDGRRTCFDDDGGRRDLKECPRGSLTCPWGPTCRNALAPNDCDEPNGVDNAFGRMLVDLVSLVPDFDRERADPNRALAFGTANVLIHLGDYNGEADDTSVTAGFFVSSGLAEHALPAVGDAAPDAALGEELWDRRSLREWYVDPASLERQDALVPRLTAKGHVRDYVLFLEADVFKLPDGIAAGVEVHGAIITGKLVRRVGPDAGSADGDWAIVRGRVGGTIEDVNLMTAIGAFVYGVKDGKPLSFCTDKPQDAPTRGQLAVCPYADLLGSSDSGSCSALSLAFGYELVPARFGPVRAPEGGPASCEAVGVTFQPCN